MLNDHWFADISDEEDAVEGSPWQPFLQIAGGCFPLPIWFNTEADCQSFIATIPQGSAVTFGHVRCQTCGDTRLVNDEHDVEYIDCPDCTPENVESPTSTDD